jgi:hypothetical protein
MIENVNIKSSVQAEDSARSFTYGATPKISKMRMRIKVSPIYAPYNQ